MKRALAEAVVVVRYDGSPEPFSPSATRFSTYCNTTRTKAEWLQVSGDTDSGAPVTGCTCSASTPEGSAFRAHHSR